MLAYVLLNDPDPGSPAASRCRPAELGCYAAHYAQLVKAAGPESAFRAFRADYDRDPLVRARCHDLAHVIGHTAGGRYGDVAEAYRHGDRFCASGYYHGVLQAIVGGPARSRILRRPDGVCAALPRGSVDQGNCSHGLGHGFMAVRADDVPAALGLCDRLSASYQRGNCYDGVFMENVMARRDRGPSRYLDPNRPLGLCSALGARYRGSCLKRQVLYALEITRGDFRTMFGLCGRLGSAARADCEHQLGEAAADVNIRSRPDVAAETGGTAQLCGLGRDRAARLRCVEGAAGYFVFHYDRTAEATAFCRLFGSLRRACTAAVRDARTG